MTNTEALRKAAMVSKAWPFEEARKLLARYPQTPAKGHVLFETGYGPSGLPHIGTFGEVARTTMVRRAYETLSDVPTRLVAFSDDMDGLRKVPDNVPNQAMLTAYLGKPLTAIPDPFGTHESFAHHNNAMLRDFLDRFGFDYETAPVFAAVVFQIEQVNHAGRLGRGGLALAILARQLAKRHAAFLGRGTRGQQANDEHQSCGKAQHHIRGSRRSQGHRPLTAAWLPAAPPVFDRLRPG